MKNNTILGSILITVGFIILTAITVILYYLNITAIWIAESLGASGEAATGIQIIIIIIIVMLLLSSIALGFILIISGIGILKGKKPLTLIEKFWDRADDILWKKW